MESDGGPEVRLPLPLSLSLSTSESVHRAGMLRARLPAEGRRRVCSHVHAWITACLSGTCGCSWRLEELTLWACSPAWLACLYLGSHPPPSPLHLAPCLSGPPPASAAVTPPLPRQHVPRYPGRDMLSPILVMGGPCVAGESGPRGFFLFNLLDLWVPQP